MYKTLGVLIALVAVIGFGFVGDAKAIPQYPEVTFFIIDDDSSSDDNAVSLNFYTVPPGALEFSTDHLIWTVIPSTNGSGSLSNISTTGTGDPGGPGTEPLESAYQQDWEQVWIRYIGQDQVNLSLDWLGQDNVSDNDEWNPHGYTTYGSVGIVYGDDFWMTVSISTGQDDDLAPVPIGSPLVLLGSGLIGFVSLMRVRRPDRKTA